MEDVVSAWKGLEWDDLQIRIEEEIRVIGNRQDEGEEGRRLLLDESTKYRENTTKDTRKVAVPLIKAFQKEVDRLTSRGRATEAALIDICSRLTHIPDPSSLLEQALIWKAQAEKTNNAIEEANQLRSNIAELHAEFADLQNQDVTVRQLRERIRELEELKVQEVDQTVLDTEKRIREEVTEREAEMNMRSDKLKSENAALEKKVHELEIHLKDAQRRLDSAKIVADQRETLETEQIDILSKDLASANRRVASLELEVSRLTSDLADAHASSKRGGLEDIAALGGLMKEKDEQIGRLQAENRKLMDTLDAETKRHKSERDGLVRQLSEQQKLVAELKEVVNERTDYDSIKNELRLLREIEFGDAATANEVAINQLGSTVQALDRLLAEKNRRLQNENAQLRVTNQKQQGDDLMQAIIAGSHHTVVEKAAKIVGKELAEKYSDPDVDCSLDRQISRAITERKEELATKNSANSSEDDSQTLYKILLNMGKPLSSHSPQRDRSPTEIPFEQFRYSPKLTNYTGESAKSPQEIQTIQDLQAKVASNIRELGTKALNTGEIAKQCKRLMVSYNIGQRLFAKYVMNQSQGSLSELLSKPRHWSKLTDKGREAFRRIYGWISDDKAIELLCALSPRRAWPNDMEQKVEHPSPESLWESNSNKLPPEEPDENRVQKRAASAREDQYRLAGTPHAANSGTTQRNSRWRHDDIPKEKIMSIFQTELAKLREQESSLERAIASRTFGTGHVRRVIMDDLNSPYHEMSHSERMAAINHAHQVMTNRMKCGLAPITQEQFEEFGHVDTEDVVRQIKEFLSMNSISQRQFGEHVLGLSQGSVSDLLARPKQWYMLTQKGREPFIRMKLFMREVLAAEKSANDLKNDAEDKVSSSTETVLAMVKQEVPDEFPTSEIDMQTTSEIEEPDTALLVRRVKDRLHLHGISQRIFGEHVLGVSPGGCSELFLRPRPWSSLNCRGREPYEKIITWLQDKDAIEKLISRERVEVESPVSAAPAPINENGKRASDPSFEPPPRKVQRTVISDQQKEALRFVFDHEHHPSQKTVELLAMKLNLNVRTVNNWFHNHRTRQKASMLKEGKAPSSPVYQRNKNWQEDLASMLDNVAKSCLYEESLPTMVPLSKLFHSKSVDNTDEQPEKHTSSQLDKAVERLRLLAASKCTS